MDCTFRQGTQPQKSPGQLVVPYVSLVAVSAAHFIGLWFWWTDKIMCVQTHDGRELGTESLPAEASLCWSSVG
jgi:hypothetical protein